VIALDADRPLDADDPANETFLRNLQGNILKGHGRNYTANIFLRFRVEGDDLRAALAQVAARYVTSAFAQLQQSRDYRAFGLPGAIFGNLFLTGNAYRMLQLDAPELWAERPVEGVPEPPTHSFLAGMRRAAGDLGDRLAADPLDALDEAARLAAIERLEPLERAYVTGTIDAMLLLADDAEAYVLREARAAVAWLDEQGWATVLAVEIGRALRNEDEEGIEHFGYVDGRSQPLFLRSDFTHLNADGSFDPSRSREKTNDKRVSRETGRLDVWNPFAPLSLVLVEDKATTAPDAYGSYYVFRKLEQDVLHFCMAEQALADALGLAGSDRPRAGAMVVGRFRDGTPLALNETDGFVPAKANNFRYDGRDAAMREDVAPSDPFALKCPFQSHIRRVNPRQVLDDADPQATMADRDRVQRSRRIARRGITYGERRRSAGAFPALDDLPTGGVGLLFACFQSSILNQFAFLQKKWSNSLHFPSPGGSSWPGQDPVLGPVPQWPQRWRKEYDGTLVPAPPSVEAMDFATSHPTECGFGGFVTFRGGEFFFAPSLPFLRNEA
jgi:Dyp-type peroxidase family